MDSAASKPPLQELIEKSLSGYVYDLAIVVHRLYKSKFVCAKLKGRQWYTFDGLKWSCTEIGPYHDVSTHMVTIYQNMLDSDMKELEVRSNNDTQSMTKSEVAEMDALKKHIVRLEAVISKLKNVNFKESLCKESMYMFYDPEFLGKLDKDRHLVCFKNGVLDLRTKEFREGRKEDYLSLYVDDNYIQSGEAFQMKMQRFMTFRENVILKRKGSQFRFPESDD
jgi:hypothetical protein